MFLKRVQGVVTRREFYLITVALLFVALIFQLDLLTRLPIITNDVAGDSTSSHLNLGLAKSNSKYQSPAPSSLQTSVSESKVVWGKSKPPKTTLIQHSEGWTILDNLYMLNGTIYIVTDTPDKFPERRLMISSGYPVYNGDEEVSKREPTDADMRIISTKEAKNLFGSSANRVDGSNLIATEPHQFIAHYYHFCAELLLGFWRTYSSLDLEIGSTGRATIPPPNRMMFSHVKTDQWRDYAKMNQYILRAVFPGVAMEFEQDWLDRAETNRPWKFDRVILADRAASMRGKAFLSTQRFAAGAFSFPGGAKWWLPVRDALVNFVGPDEPKSSKKVNKPVITYISRQSWGRRMLKPADHESLVAALKKIEAEYGYEVNIVSMDKLSREEQIQLAGRTTIMLGVHGNGLTALLWMNPTPRSTVIEFFYPGGFTFDYEWTTRAVGMTHFGFWGSTHFTSPDLPPVAYPAGFQGNEIPLDGQAVADLIVQRLSLNEELDD